MQVAKHLTSDAAEAEGLVQLTLMTAIERAASFDPEGVAKEQELDEAL
ncbi:MAG: DNA-directed RNA polymerase specialized sigma24 family protein [Planctomycetota bacterium]